MAQQNKKITELPLVEAADGLLTLGVNSQNESVQIPLGDLLGKINNKKKNKDFVMTMTYDKITTDEGAEFDLVDTEWDALADIVSHGECDIVLRDGIRNAYQLDHVFLSDGMPFGYKILPNNRTLNIATVNDSASSTLKLVWKFNDGAVTYDDLGGKPSINGKELTGGENTAAELGLQGQLSTSADLALSDDVLSLTEMAKKRLFIDLWNQAAGDFGRYNEETGYFELFEIRDIGWDEALLIYRLSGNWDYYNVNFYWSGYGANYGFNPRAYLPLTNAYNGEVGITLGSHLHNDSIEYLSLCRALGKDERSLIITAGTHAFRFDKLKKIYGIIQINEVYNNNQHIFAMANLVYGKFKFTRSDYKIIYFRANLDYECSNYLFTQIPTQNANKQCVFKLAANMFNRLSGTSTDYDISGGTKAEWMAIADLATSKNITLATE